MRNRLLEAVIRCLSVGLPVNISPEGRRSHDPGMVEGQPGTAYIASRAQVPVVPVGITGTDAVAGVWKSVIRPSLRMMIGEPLELPPIDLRSPLKKNALITNTKKIMYAIANLLPPEYRGVYAAKPG